MSGSGKRKPLIRAKQLEWVSQNRTGQHHIANPAVGIKIEVLVGMWVVIVESMNGYSFAIRCGCLRGKGKTERAKVAAQKWWNRFVRSLRSGLEVKVD
jgi:hypothetical protein